MCKNKINRHKVIKKYDFFATPCSFMYSFIHNNYNVVNSMFQVFTFLMMVTCQVDKTSFCLILSPLILRILQNNGEKYMGVQRYEISRVLNSISHEWVQQTSEILSWTGKNKFPVSKQPCRSLLIIYKKHLPKKKKSTLFALQEENVLPFIHGTK